MSRPQPAPSSPADVKASCEEVLQKVRATPNEHGEAAEQVLPAADIEGSGRAKFVRTVAASWKKDRAATLLRCQRELDTLARRATNQTDQSLVEAASNELLKLCCIEGIHLAPTKKLSGFKGKRFAYLNGPEPGLERNLLIMLHGFGGRKEPFADLAKSLQLPKTAVLALDGLEELPEGLVSDDPVPAFSWHSMFDDDFNLLEGKAGDLRRLESLQRTTLELANLLKSLEIELGWGAKEVFFLGYGQGGTAMLDLLVHPPSTLPRHLLGGCVGVATELLPERLDELTRSASRVTGFEELPVLLIHGDQADQPTPLRCAIQSLKALRDTCRGGKATMRLEIFRERGGEMLRGGHAEEMRCFMQFMSDNLRGVGRHGSAEVMEKMGAERVIDLEEGTLEDLNYAEAEEGQEPSSPKSNLRGGKGTEDLKFNTNTAASAAAPAWSLDSMD